MAREFDGSTDRLDWANIYDPTGLPFSFYCSVKFDVLNVNQYLFTIQENDEDLAIICWNNGASVSGSLRLTRATSSGSEWRRWSGSGAPSTGTWHRIIFTAASPNYADFECYVDGTTPGTVADDNSPVSENDCEGVWSFGGRLQDDNRCLNGTMAEIAVWDRVITTAERSILDAGYSPAFIQSGLRFHSELIGRTAEVDLITGAAATHDGTSVADHPQIIRRSRLVVPARASVAVPGGGAFFSLS
jgi:hypothetical protein